MGLTEYVLLALVILVPAVLAITITAWSLEQVKHRSKRGRRRQPAKVEQSREGSEMPPPAA